MESENACGVQELVPCPGGEEASRVPCTGKRGSRGRAAFGRGPSTPSVTKLTDRRIDWLVRQAQGTARPRETVGQLAARWGVTPRWLRKLLQRWRQSGVVPRLDPRRRPPGPPLTDEEKRQIEEEHTRSPRGATKIWRALARRGIHVPTRRSTSTPGAGGGQFPTPASSDLEVGAVTRGSTRGHCSTPTSTEPRWTIPTSSSTRTTRAAWSWPEESSPRRAPSMRSRCSRRLWPWRRAGA